jgi:uncharacterized protein HemY
VSALSACPLCRAVLPAEGSAQQALTCPSCGADLTAFVNLEARAAQYARACRELLSRGETEAARTILQQLPAIAELDPQELAELGCRLALLDGDYTAAATLLRQCSALTAGPLSAELELRHRLHNSAQELYNYALSSALRSEYHLAAEQLLQAAEYAPREPAIWLLKLKADLKCGNYIRCYDDLRALDSLDARPEQYAALEQQLPAVA